LGSKEIKRQKAKGKRQKWEAEGCAAFLTPFGANERISSALLPFEICLLPFDLTGLGEARP
jgi:hypothetical protein